MLTGDTGAGKSSACNFFFGRKVFEVGPRMSSVTLKSNSAEMEVNGRKLQLVDTPGFCNNFDNDEERVNELGKAMLLTKTGVHAIALVINATAAEAMALKEIELLRRLWPFMFVIFTGAKCCGANDQKQREVLISSLDSPNCPKYLQIVMERVNWRFMMLENLENSIEYHNTKVEEFLAMVQNIYSANRRLCTNHLFSKANHDAKLEAQNKGEEDRKSLQNMAAEMKPDFAKMQSEQQKQQAIPQQNLLSQLLAKSSLADDEKVICSIQ